MSFMEHLEELRWVIIKSCIAVVICMCIMFCFKTFLFDVLVLGPTKPEFVTNRLLCRLGQLISANLCINSEKFNIISIKMAGQITVHFAVAIVAGIIISIPYIIYQIWTFIVPALHDNEKQTSRGAVMIISALFIMGVLFGYYLLSPLSIHFLVSYNVSDDVVNQINIRSYISTVSGVCLACGVMFELPVITYFLTKVGILTPTFMRRYRRHAIVVIVILSAFITPPDVFSQTLVAIPLLGLYEISVRISERIVKKREEEFNKLMADGESTETLPAPITE